MSTLKNDTTYLDKVFALASHLGIYPEEITEIGDKFEAQGAEYIVVTDDEADDLWEQDLDNYIEECILPELNERYHMYFDNEKWKRDARFDGRANSLSRYDGGEDEISVENETYFIYRTN